MSEIIVKEKQKYLEGSEMARKVSVPPPGRGQIRTEIPHMDTWILRDPRMVSGMEAEV